MSDKLNKKEQRRSSSSSSFSSTSSESASYTKTKIANKIKEESRPSNTVSVNKVRLDIGYKIQQEELTDSEESDVDHISPRGNLKSSDVLLHPHGRKQEVSKSPERKRYRSNSSERRERSHSKESRKDRTQSKDFRQDIKSSLKYDSKVLERKDRSKSKERRRERSRSRERRKIRSGSSERRDRSVSRDRKRDRSRSREKKRDRSRSRDRKEKKRDRSRSREKLRERSRRDSRSPSHYKDKDRGHSKRRSRDKSRERSSKRSRSRSRSRSRPRKRSRSRSRSFERSKRIYDKKLQKLNILEKLGIELKVPEGQALGETGSNSSGFSIPSYYNPAGVNPLKYAQQMQKRRLIWGSKKSEGEGSGEKKDEEKKSEGGPESVWKGTTFSQDQDGKLTAKFKRLMGIKDSDGEAGSSSKSSELIQKQEEMFNSMEKQYEVARVSTHTHRGLGLGFGVHLPR